MSDEAVPPYRRRPSLAEKLILNSTFGRLGNNPFLICHDYPKQPNREKPMTQCQTPKPPYNPGDRVLCINPSMSIGEPGTIEVVFIGFDPEQPTVALVRDVGNVNAPIRAIHGTYIKALPPKPKYKVVELFARRNKNQRELVVIEHVSDFDPMVDQSLRIIDARVTEDGLVQVKVDMTKSVERDAILAAHKNPTTGF